MDLEEALEVDCDKINDYINFREIALINLYVTDPEKFGERFQEDKDVRESYEKIIEPIKESSPAYLGGSESDYFEIHEAGTIQNLLETEFQYLCRANNDAVYLSAALMHRIASGHPFGEGNKRTAYLAACVFLIKHQTNLGLDTFSIPSLDEDLLESLGDIAEDSESINPKKLSNQYRKGLKEGLKSVKG